MKLEELRARQDDAISMYDEDRAINRMNQVATDAITYAEQLKRERDEATALLIETKNPEQVSMIEYADKIARWLIRRDELLARIEGDQDE